MVERIIIGHHPIWGMGGFVSKPGIGVATAGKFDFMFSTFYENMQINVTGAFLMDGSYGAYTAFGWPDLGYYPLIMLACPAYELQLDFTSTATGAVRRLNFGETGSTISDESDAWVYYCVLKTQLP